jgi:predicted metal-dependent peptidase
MYMEPNLEHSYWDLACDIAVENIITELGLKSVSTARELQQLEYIAAVKRDLKYVTAEKIYSYLRQTEPDLTRIAQIRGKFFADDHELWYMTGDEIADKYLQPNKEETSNGGEKSNGEENPRQRDSTSVSHAQMAIEWKKISERMQVEMETFGKQRGINLEEFEQNLSAVNREKYDYTSFLKKFAVMSEAMKINDDEFDYVFYTYGLQLYKKMPLIEPLEYKEVKLIKEFAIAIDTSDSTSGALVQTFLQKTYNILKSTESFYRKINLHIIQCDAAIQEDVKITSQEEFDRYIETIKIHGLGGTDFRPVFSYVDQLIANKEFENLRGLIYFTDGYGDFPTRKPNYETAFVFVEDGYSSPAVPPWAIKLVLQRESI